MTADEIRDAIGDDSWMGYRIYEASNGATVYVLIEIAAQLAELNAQLRKGSK